MLTKGPKPRPAKTVGELEKVLQQYPNEMKVHVGVLEGFEDISDIYTSMTGRSLIIDTVPAANGDC